MREPPYIDRKLVEWLQETLPERQPEPSGNERLDLFRAGQQDVIARLRSLLEQQEDQIGV